ncbi:MAG: VWA domain-containing protein [Acidobacteria bacterium]|nr:VWA domain-containing protein [Acidobacteriota bacterium]
MPRRSTSWAAIGLAAAGATIALAQGEQRPPVFRSGVELIELGIAVVDRNRQPVRGLSADDFTLLEDGTPQRIVQFSEVEVPARDGPIVMADEIAAPDLSAPQFADRRLVAIVLDDFGLPFGNASTPAGNSIYIPEAKKVARQIVQSLGPKDFGAVVLTRDLRGYPDFTNMSSKLTAAIEQFRPPGEAEAMALMQTARGRVGMIATLRQVIGYMDQMPQQKKVVVYVGLPPEVDFARRWLSSTADRLEDLIRAAQAAGIGIFGFDVGGPVDRSGQGTLLALAENTGGRAIGYAQLESGVRQVLAENASYYLIGFEPAAPRDGKPHKLDVKVRRGGVSLRFRRSYVAPGPPDMVKGEAPAFDAPVDAAVTALGRALESRRTFVSASAQRGFVAVVAEISSREYAAKWTAGADVDVAVTDSAGALVGTAAGRIEKGTRAVMVGIPLNDAAGQPLPASRGPFRAAVKIRAEGAVLEDAAQASTGGAWLGAARVWRGQGSARSPLQPTAEYQFSRSERLFVEWAVVQPADRRTARLLRRTGEPTPVTLTLTDGVTAGTPTMSTTFALTQLAPGDYVLEVVAGRGDDTERRLLPFRIVQ